MKVKDLGVYFNSTNEEIIKLLNNVTRDDVIFDADSKVSKLLTKRLAKRFGASYPFPGNLILDDYDFTVLKDNTLEVKRYNSKSIKHNIVIPHRINGMVVSSIGNNAFVNCKCLKKVIIPNTIKTIKSKAFCNCVNLHTIVMKLGLEDIENYAFNNLVSLVNVNIPRTVKKLGDKAFNNCLELRKK